jgi:microcystin-dependent protein
MANTTNFAIETPTVGGFRNVWGGTLNTGLSKIDELLALAMPIGTIQMYPKTTAPVATTNGGTWLVCDGSSKVRTDYPELHTLITNTYGTYPSGTTFLLPDLRSRVPVGYNTDTISGRSTRALALGSGTETHTLVEAEIPLHDHPITDDGHIHPVTDTTHFHIGDQTGGKTGQKALVITDPEHSHTFTRRNDWGDNNYDTGYVNGGLVAADVTVSSSATGISIADHDHSVTTDAKLTGITTTTTNTARLTATENNSSGDGSHNIMQPYLVVNYIILAKHPTF